MARRAGITSPTFADRRRPVPDPCGPRPGLVSRHVSGSVVDKRSGSCAGWSTSDGQTALAGGQAAITVQAPVAGLPRWRRSGKAHPNRQCLPNP
jgi:hypothetical protein